MPWLVYVFHCGRVMMDIIRHAKKVATTRKADWVARLFYRKGKKREAKAIEFGMVRNGTVYGYTG